MNEAGHKVEVGNRDRSECNGTGHRVDHRLVDHL
jgi:hypothetical protein